jgi:hypothetical protein
MSHTIVHETACRHAGVIERTCQRVNAQYLGVGRFDLYSNRQLPGIGIRLRDWTYPVIFDELGKASYDNMDGAWGDEAELRRFCQEYGLEAGRYAYEQRAEVASVQEVALPNGHRQLVVTLNDQSAEEFGGDNSDMFADSARL